MSTVPCSLARAKAGKGPGAVAVPRGVVVRVLEDVGSGEQKVVLPLAGAASLD